MASLKSRFEEMLHIDWYEFVKIEQASSISLDDVGVCSLVRTCCEAKDVKAVKLAFDRADGVLETKLDIRVPKFFIRYTNAKEVQEKPKQIEKPKDEKEEKTSYDPATAKLRETLQEMRKMPKDIVPLVLKSKERIDKGEIVDHAPMVKSVIIANFLNNVASGDIKAIYLLFDQIDGKLPKPINLFDGEDIYMDDPQMLEVAPSHAILGDDGVYYAEDKNITNLWIMGLARNQKGLEAIVEGLEDDQGE